MKKKFLVPVLMAIVSTVFLSNVSDAECTAAATCNGDSLFCAGDYECAGIPNVSVTCDGVVEECESPAVQ